MKRTIRPFAVEVKSTRRDRQDARQVSWAAQHDAVSQHRVSPSASAELNRVFGRQELSRGGNPQGPDLAKQSAPMLDGDLDLMVGSPELRHARILQDLTVPVVDTETGVVSKPVRRRAAVKKNPEQDAPASSLDREPMEISLPVRAETSVQYDGSILPAPATADSVDVIAEATLPDPVDVQAPDRRGRDLRRGRGDPELKLGERWKRHLPRSRR